MAVGVNVDVEVGVTVGVGVGVGVNKGVKLGVGVRVGEPVRVAVAPRVVAVEVGVFVTGSGVVAAAVLLTVRTAVDWVVAFVEVDAGSVLPGARDGVAVGVDVTRESVAAGGARVIEGTTVGGEASVVETMVRVLVGEEVGVEVPDGSAVRARPNAATYRGPRVIAAMEPKIKVATTKEPIDQIISSCRETPRFVGLMRRRTLRGDG